VKFGWTYLALIAALVAGGCGKQAGTAESAGDIRGEPIVAAAVPNTDQTPSNASAAVPSSAASAQQSGYLTVGFDKLSGYNIEVSDELLGPQTNKVTVTADAQIPKDVKELSNKKISLRGFMLPLKVEGGLVTELLIMKDQSMCCYGTTPRINEWVSVKMTKGGIKPLMDEPVTLMGTLKVGETRENGYLVGIYAMDGEKMAERN
jgi:hypothetical protein